MKVILFKCLSLIFHISVSPQKIQHLRPWDTLVSIESRPVLQIPQQTLGRTLLMPSLTEEIKNLLYKQCEFYQSM